MEYSLESKKMVSFEDSLASCLNFVASLDVADDIKTMLTEGVELIQEKLYWGCEVGYARQSHYVREKLQTFQHKYLREVTHSGTLEQQLAAFKRQIEGLLHEQLKLAEENYSLREEVKALREAGYSSEDRGLESNDVQQEALKWKQVCVELSMQVRSLIVQSCDPNKSKLQFTISRIEELQNLNVSLLAQVKEVKLKAMKTESELRQLCSQKLEAALHRAKKLEEEREFAKSVFVQSYSGVPHSRVSALESLVSDKDSELNLAQKVNLQLEDELTWLKNKVLALEAQIASLQHERDSMREALRGSDLYRTNLQKAVWDLEQQLISVSKRRNLMEQIEEKKKLVHNLEEATGQLKTLHHEHQATLRHLEVSENSIAELSQALLELREEQAKKDQDNGTKFQNEIQGLRQALMKARNDHKLEVSTLTQEKTQLEQEAARLAETAAAHEKCAGQLADFKTRQAAKASNLKLKYIKLLEEAHEQITKLSKEPEDDGPKDEVDQLKQQIEELNEQIEEITEENLNLQRLADSADSDKHDRTAKALANAQAELVEAKSQLKETQAEKSSLVQELDILQASMADQFTEVDTDHTKDLVRPTQEKTIAALKADLEVLRRVETENTELKRNQEALDVKYADRISKARELIKKKHESIRKLEGENEKLRSQVVAPAQVAKLCSVLQKLLETQKLS